MKPVDNKIILFRCAGLALAGGACLAASAAVAQQYSVQTTGHGTVLDVPEGQPAYVPKVLPHRSMTKAAVRRQFGNPERSFPAVGKPPITRWDYPDFRVFFEYDLVLHAVVPGNFPVIDHRNQLISDR